jgi:hypothetical protein
MTASIWRCVIVSLTLFFEARRVALLLVFIDSLLQAIRLTGLEMDNVGLESCCSQLDVV